MRNLLGHRAWRAGFVLAVVLLVACGCQSGSNDRDDPLGASKLGPTVASVAVVASPEPVKVEGYGLVAGLPGTGSGICPVELRVYLRQYILAQLPSGSLDIDEFIDSRNTAVVRLEGTIPAIATKGERFDVQVRPVRFPAGTVKNGPSDNSNIIWFRLLRAVHDG